MFKIFKEVKQLRTDVNFLLSEKIKDILAKQDIEEKKSEPAPAPKSKQRISSVTGKPVRKYTKKK